MSKILEVVVPFFMMEVGDTFELSEDGKSYISEFHEEFSKNDESNSNISSSYSSVFSISTEYAKELVKTGFLVECKPANEKFVNIFGEIDNLLAKYEADLLNVEKDYANEPACLKVEKVTVMKNLIKVLKHLKSLKK